MRKLFLLLLLIAVAGGGYWFMFLRDQAPERPSADFADEKPATGLDPDNPTRELHVDFAELERTKPLTREERARLTPANLAGLSQEEVDQIYGRLSAGPIPDGYWDGGLFFPRGSGGKTRMGEIIGSVLGEIVNEKVQFAERIGHGLWQGKFFFKEQGVLRNAIQDLKLFEILIDDPTKVPKAEIPAKGWRSWISSTSDVWQLFPAKLHCGQSLLDGRRESVIIDYAYTDDVDGYQELPDSLAGRRGLRIRDEIRMVRPGFYLGRAYADRIFLLNFTLYDPAIAEAGMQGFLNGEDITEECWPGETGLAAAN
ncbi:MAG: hypothetical protein HC855_04400 [Rhizobiales bacterium]|nr:hypothetical protein [Hyphomicrobiales bacterium]